MSTPKVFASEYRFCLILWELEPIKSTRLAQICQERLGWSKATTYTVIKRLCQRGVVRSEQAVVSSLVSREQVQTAELDELMEQTFQGSLPAFLAAFSKRQELTAAQVAELQRMIEEWEEKPASGGGNDGQ